MLIILHNEIALKRKYMSFHACSLELLCSNLQCIFHLLFEIQDGLLPRFPALHIIAGGSKPEAVDVYTILGTVLSV